VKRSPLDAAHRALGAKMVPFGGWEMPLSFAGGTLAEHHACRTSCVAFDVSHLGTVEVTGRAAFDTLQANLTNDLRKIGAGRAQYTHLLDEADASVLDDIIVWWIADGLFHVMPNASNTARVLDAIGGVDVTEQRAVIAVQGPTARQTAAEVIGSIATEVPRFGVAQFEWRDGTVVNVAGTGYTGEDGIELAVPAEGDAATDLWQALLAAGVAPAGLGARDLLRLEAGLPLHGHELGPGITPLQAGLGWVVGWDKGDFRGRTALEKERDAGPARRLRGIVVDGRQPPRDGYAVSIDGEVVGSVTSGNFSPVLGKGIAMAFLPPDAQPGTAVEVDLRGKPAEGQVVKLPFVTKS
jgi:aminomethyltransferase